jgi:hypothetical protein
MSDGDQGRGARRWLAGVVAAAMAFGTGAVVKAAPWADEAAKVVDDGGRIVDDGGRIIDDGGRIIDDVPPPTVAIAQEIAEGAAAVPGAQTDDRLRAVLEDAGWSTLCGVASGDVERSWEAIVEDLARSVIDAGFAELAPDLSDVAGAVAGAFETEEESNEVRDACEDAGDL